MVKRIQNIKRGSKSRFRILSRPELTYVSAKMVANHIEAVILDTSVDEGDADDNGNNIW